MERNRKKKPALLFIIIAVVLIMFGIDGIIMTVRIVSKAESISDEFLTIIKNAVLLIIIFGAAVFLFFEVKKISAVDKAMERGMTNAEEIARTSGVSYSKTCKLINRFIDKGVYTGGSFDPVKKEIVIKKQTQNIQYNQ